MSGVTAEHVAEVWARLVKEASDAGYSVNPDDQFARDLVRGLLENEERYGYAACPCRLASGERSSDLDIICPCDYRDADLDDYGSCYCALYVSPEIARREKKASAIPDRRPVGGPTAASHKAERLDRTGLPFPVWRCKVCGYLCARPQPPQICPVCKAGKDRFERFM